jgi:hypothetical protein
VRGVALFLDLELPVPEVVAHAAGQARFAGAVQDVDLDILVGG